MKIYLLKQNINNDYDTYDSCIVCAENEIEAKKIHPSGSDFEESEFLGTWVGKVDDIECFEIGFAHEKQERGVLLSSFNAG